MVWILRLLLVYVLFCAAGLVFGSFGVAFLLCVCMWFCCLLRLLVVDILFVVFVFGWCVSLGFVCDYGCLLLC